MDILSLLGGLLLILLGANGLTDGAASIAKRFRIPSIVIGLTIVAFGTSAPELTVSVSSALKGSADIAIGNVVGSNIFNTLMIVGCTALFAPIVISRNTLRKEIPLCILSSIVLLICANDVFLDHSSENIISITDGLLLLCFFIIFLGYTFAIAFQGKKEGETEEEIKQAMAVVGKTGPEDELNCSGCGYDTCRDFAIAMLEGRAEENMCVSYMRRIAHDKATVLLQKIPAGVLLVNSELKVVDMNQSCATLMGEDIASIYEVDPGLNGMELKNICSYEDLFRAVLTTGKEIIERQVREEDRTWIISIYNIQPHRLVFGLLQDLREPYVRKEWMLEKTQEVIKKHMETVQQVACLLGENAAFTDATLRSVMEAYKKNDQKKPL